MTTETSQALEFSALGDQVWGRFADRLPLSRKRRLLGEVSLEVGRFEQLRLAMCRFLSSCLADSRSLPEQELLARLIAERQTIPNYRIDGLMLPKRENSLEFNLLHKALAECYRPLEIADLIEGIDLPINVRVVYGKPGGGRPLPFSSSVRHSDVWAGVPVDAVVVVLPVLGGIEHITIECGEMPREAEYEAMRSMSNYLEGDPYDYAEKYSDVPMKLGHAYMVDARLLHQTVRYKPEGVRVSIDFRFRFNDERYRSITPEVAGPDGRDIRVPYSRWLKVGQDEVIVFDETMAEAMNTRNEATGAPFGAIYRSVQLFPK